MNFRLFVVLCSCLLCDRLHAQDSVSYPIAADRQLWHRLVDAEQKKIGEVAARLRRALDSSGAVSIRSSLIDGVDQLQKKIELDTSINTNNKKRVLRNLQTMLKGYLDHPGNRDFPLSQAPLLLEAFEKCWGLDLQSKSIAGMLEQYPYAVVKILSSCFIFPSENPGLPAARLLVLRKYCELHPDEILDQLKDHAEVYFADSLIVLAARRDLTRLYNYAQVQDALGNRIRQHPDSLVQLIATLANSKSGQLYLPFLDNLIHGKITLEEIDFVKDDMVAYYQLLVKTRIDYAGRLLPPYRDTALEMRALAEMMTRKAQEYFIHEINSLHSVPQESVRFKVLDPLTAQELYYLAVLSEDQIYTSSFVKGVYPRIFQRMLHPRADSLLLSVNGDYFRKFIKMCAAYNTLTDLLSRLDKKNAPLLMKAFIHGLEQSAGIEEAVDVADSYSSIRETQRNLANLIQQEVTANYLKNEQKANAKGMAVYKILDVLFRSAEATQQSNLSEQLGIPPVYSVELSSLADDSGRIVMQVFFYGDEDKDGQHSFVSFLNLFRRSASWQVVENPQWVTIRSKGAKKPVYIFANKPLYGEDDPEEAAINDLENYLVDHHLQPSIYVHRGHSYHVKSTLKRIGSSARIVLLGSCGGYNNLSEVLSISEDAHIISSKQTGTMFVNDPLLQAINTQLLAGKNINWVTLWQSLAARLGTSAARASFDDYIPPYKNLGAVFMKAYKKALSAQELE